jgi:hypothetical protein
MPESRFLICFGALACAGGGRLKNSKKYIVFSRSNADQLYVWQASLDFDKFHMYKRDLRRVYRFYASIGAKSRVKGSGSSTVVQLQA